MTWNYRIVRRTDGGETVYGIHEAYYGEGTALPQSITVDPVGAVGASVDELRQVLAAMSRALEKPPIDYQALQEL